MHLLRNHLFSDFLPPLPALYSSIIKEPPLLILGHQRVNLLFPLENVLTNSGFIHFIQRLKINSF